MKKTPWFVRLAAGALMIAALAGVALAAGQQGSQSDPLVTLSYLNEKAGPDLLAQVDARIAQQEAELTAQLNQVVDRYLQEGGGAPSGTGTDGSFTVVTLRQGQKLSLSAGCEVLFRGGAASCIAGSAPGLVDMTGGSDLPNGGALAVNHLYLATTDGRGVQASANTTLLVRGGYAISG